MKLAKTCCKPGTALLLAVIMPAAGCDEKHPQAAQTPPAIVQVSHPLERNITDYQVFTARTQAVQSVDIKARVTGYLTKILFKDGDEVNQGAVLFQIDDRPYKAALDQAKAALEVAKAALVKAQADYDIGISVQSRDKGAISQQEIVRRLGSRDEAKASVDQSLASLEKAQLNFDWCSVIAPISGRATRHLIDVGNLVSQDTSTLTNIVSLKPIWAYFDVDQNTAFRYQQRVKEGKMKGARQSEIPVKIGLGGADNFPIAGTIDFISNQLDPNTATIQVRAVAPNTDGSLLAGVFVRIQVPISAPHPALLVTDRAIGTNQGQKFVLVVSEKKEVEYRPVDVGQLHDGLREVMRYRTIAEPGADGKDVTKQVEVLKPTNLVIVDGLQRVRPGVTVEPQLVNMLTLLRE